MEAATAAELTKLPLPDDVVSYLASYHRVLDFFVNSFCLWVVYRVLPFRPPGQ